MVDVSFFLRRDTVLFLHVIMGLLVAVLAVWALLELNKKSSLVKPLSVGAAIVSWVSVLPAARLYLLFYPPTKTLIKAGPAPWAHSIIMETKEHWALLVPLIVTVAAWLVISGKEKESKKWWILAIVMIALIAVLGRVVKMGAVA